ncbi:unnamed protein product [Musa textilis]
MKGVNSTRLILLQPSSNHKQGGNGVNTSISISVSHHHRIWLIGLLSFFTFASLLTLLSTTTARDPSDLPSASSSTAAVASARSASYGKPSPLPAPVFDALVNYAASSNSTGKMREEDLRAVAGVLRRRAPCNLLVFGIGHETPLWRALNHGGRTVFLDENEYYVARVEGRNPGLEAYDVAYTTKVREMPDLLAAARRQRRGRVPAGAEPALLRLPPRHQRPPQPALRRGLGRHPGGRAQGARAGGAGPDVGHLHGRRHGQVSRSGPHRRARPRPRPGGGEGVQRGVPLPGEPRRRHPTPRPLPHPRRPRRRVLLQPDLHGRRRNSHLVV